MLSATHALVLADEEFDAINDTGSERQQQLQQRRGGTARLTSPNKVLQIDCERT